MIAVPIHWQLVAMPVVNGVCSALYRPFWPPGGTLKLYTVSFGVSCVLDGNRGQSGAVHFLTSLGTQPMYSERL